MEKKKNQFSANGVLKFLPPFTGGAGKARVSSWPEKFPSESPENMQLKSKERKPEMPSQQPEAI